MKLRISGDLEPTGRVTCQQFPSQLLLRRGQDLPQSFSSHLMPRCRCRGRNTLLWKSTPQKKAGSRKEMATDTLKVMAKVKIKERERRTERLKILAYQ